ncbi:hypothetical protein os1_15520 [Comamonadaceae bacterium OS-1]|nr:hypothetical protein os1_15520 [Comamonadaceae bacterium OS-1]
MQPIDPKTPPVDRRNDLRRAAAQARKTMAPEFQQLGADEIMAFMRGPSVALEAKPGKSSKSSST